MCVQNVIQNSFKITAVYGHIPYDTALYFGYSVNFKPICQRFIFCPAKHVFFLLHNEGWC